jgi:hypothetical protein
MTTDDISVTLHVKASFAINLGLYDGRITKEVIAESINNLVKIHGIGDWIDGWEITEVRCDGDGQLVESTDT